MAIFEVSPQKVLKKIKKFSAEGSMSKVPVTVREERAKLLEDSGVAVDLVAFLLDIGHPDLAADIAEEAMRRHRPAAMQIRRILTDRFGDFSRSTELLRVAWQSHLDRRDFHGAIEVLSLADKICETRLLDMIEDRMKSSMRFDGSVHPDADQSALVSWGLCLYRKERPNEAIDFLWKVCREVEFPHRDISQLAFWIGDRSEGLDTVQWISLMGIAATSNQMDRALQFAALLLDSELSPDSAVDASAVIEKWMVPVDRSGRSASLLAKMHTAAGKTDAASKVLEGIYTDALDREKLADAIDDLLSHPESGAAPLLLAARLSLEEGDLDSARISIERAFESGDADGARLLEVSRSLIAETGETAGDIAVKLASYLVENGDITDAVHSLYPIVDNDPAWVFTQVQKLIARDRSSGMVLALLSTVLLETGKKEQADAVLDHLLSRRDRKSFREAAEVLDSLESQVRAFPELREARARFRFRSGRRDDAASDWFQLLLSGIDPSSEGRELLTSGIRIGTVEILRESDFSASTPFQAFFAALICLRERDPEAADPYLAMALDDRELHGSIAERLDELPTSILERFDLSGLLPGLAATSAETVSRILEKLHGTEDWKLALVTELNWGDTRAEALFRLRYLLSQGSIFLAGSSYRDGSTDDPSIEAVAQCCRLAAEGKNREALELLEKPVTRDWTAPLARSVLTSLLEHMPEEQLRLRLLTSTSFETEKNFSEAAGILEPVLDRQEAVATLEEMYERHPAETEIVRMLVRAYHSAGDFPRFQSRSSVLLDLDPSAAAAIVEMTTSIREAVSPGPPLIFAARIARRFSIEVDVDDLVTRAVLLEPELASSVFGGEFGLLNPVAESICSLASGNGERFAQLVRENPELDLHLTSDLVDIGIDSWDSAGDSEALMALAEYALTTSLTEQGVRILADVSGSGRTPWSTLASERLLQEVEAGNAGTALFWSSASDPGLISDALSRLLPDGYGNLTGTETTAVASALLKSGQDIRSLLDLSGDDKLFPPEDAALASELASACLTALSEDEGPEPLNGEQTDTLIGILFRGGRTTDATAMVRRIGTDPKLDLLRRELQRIRSQSDETGIRKAVALFYSGDPAGTLEELGGLEELDPQAMDLKARAQWDLGLRSQAIRTWMGEYALTGDRRPLRRLLWSLERAGSISERTALRRFILDKYPDISGSIAGIRADAGGLETISGLHAAPKAKKVQND